MPSSRLIPITYYNASKEIPISAYADLIIIELARPEPILRCIRLGGYPEMVHAMYDLIYAGATIEARIGDVTRRFSSEPKRFISQISRDGVYAEATLLAKDDNQEAQKPIHDTKEDEGRRNENDETESVAQSPRKCMIFCPAGDQERLFEEVDRKTSVPLIPEFRDYMLSELESRGILQKLTVISIREKIDAWVLRCESNDANIVSVVEDGLNSGAIQIPVAVRAPDGFDAVDNVTGYLNTFGVTVCRGMAEKLV